MVLTIPAGAPIPAPDISKRHLLLTVDHHDVEQTQNNIRCERNWEMEMSTFLKNLFSNVVIKPLKILQQALYRYFVLPLHSLPLTINPLVIV